MNYKNESIAVAQTLITPDLRKSNKIARQSRGSRRTSSKLRSAAREARDAGRDGAASIGSHVASPSGGTKRFAMNSNNMA